MDCSVCQTVCLWWLLEAVRVEVETRIKDGFKDFAHTVTHPICSFIEFRSTSTAHVEHTGCAYEIEGDGNDTAYFMASTTSNSKLQQHGCRSIPDVPGRGSGYVLKRPDGRVTETIWYVRRRQIPVLIK